MASQVTGATGLVGLFAHPIRHSESPAMQSEAFAHAGIPCVQLAFDVDEGNLEGAVESIRCLGMLGANVSMPNKTLVLKYLDSLSEEAELIGSVNTIVNRDGHLRGYCTDGIGYVLSLRDRGIDISGKKITVVGAGGAGTAIQIQCALSGAKEVSIFNRRDRFWTWAERTAQKINGSTSCKASVYDIADKESLEKEISESDILANATGLGMAPLEGKTWLEDPACLRPSLFVTDTVYSPHMTRFLEMARDSGCGYMNGEGMMLFQGAEAFRLWTGKEMDIDYMKGFLGRSVRR